MKFDNWGFFQNLLGKNQVSLKSDKNEEYFTWSPIYIFLVYFAHFFLEWEKFLKKSQILCLVTFLFENHAV